MSEMSREETINALKKGSSCLNEECDAIECEKCDNNISWKLFDEAIQQAVSDMKKLQKIEEILEKGHKKCIKCDINCDYFSIASEEYCEKLIRYDEIERIVKGE